MLCIWLFTTPVDANANGSIPWPHKVNRLEVSQPDLLRGNKAVRDAHDQFQGDLSLGASHHHPRDLDRRPVHKAHHPAEDVIREQVHARDGETDAGFAEVQDLIIAVADGEFGPVLFWQIGGILDAHKFAPCQPLGRVFVIGVALIGRGG